MRTITLEEHFFANSFRESMIKNNRGGALPGGPGIQAKLSDLGSTRLHDMDASGIDLQVISQGVVDTSSFATKENIELTQAANDQLAEAIAAHPDRFAGFATLPMSDPAAAVVEMKRAISSLGFKGIMVNGTTNGLFLDDPSFLPILEQAVALNVPVYIHPAEPPAAVRNAYYTGFDPAVNFFLSTSSWGWHSETAIYALRLILSGVFDRLPTLQIIIGHMGEMIPFMLDRINNTLAPAAKNLQRRLPEYFLQNFFITTSGFFTNPPLLLALQVMGADHILFSVDYPYSTNEQGRTFLDNASISPADKEKITHLNAERLLHLA